MDKTPELEPSELMEVEDLFRHLDEAVQDEIIDLIKSLLSEQ